MSKTFCDKIEDPRYFRAWIKRNCSQVLLSFGAILIVVLWMLTPIIARLWHGACEGAKSVGEFGDQFGVTNALFSGFALVFVVYAIFQQQKALKLQKEDIDLQKQESLRAQAELLKQTKFLSQQLDSMNAAYNSESEFETRKFEPIFLPGECSRNKKRMGMRLRNIGEPVTKSELVAHTPCRISKERLKLWSNKGYSDIVVDLPITLVALAISYENRVAGRKTKFFVLDFVGGKLQEFRDLDSALSFCEGLEGGRETEHPVDQSNEGLEL